MFKQNVKSLTLYVKFANIKVQYFSASYVIFTDNIYNVCMYVCISDCLEG